MDYPRSSSYSLRTLKNSDLKLILSWRNDINISKYMFNNHLISFEEHLIWYRKNCSNKNIKLFIIEKSNIPVAFFSLKISETNNDAEWGFYKSPQAYGKIGFDMCNLVLNHAFTNINIEKIIAYVKTINIKSINLHLKLGFKSELIDSVNFERNFNKDNFVELSLTKTHFLSI